MRLLFRRPPRGARLAFGPDMPTYTLPQLPYAFSALEPHISAAIMELHHDKHHAAYVKGANTALEQARRGSLEG